MKILYLEEKKNRRVRKALAVHGTVHHAGDIGEALQFMVEYDFDYYFVDADTPQAQSFLKHLEHDPELVAPRAVVLLTDNDEEDCSAWRVDTFVTRERIRQDVPYIFSHLRGETAGPARVLSVVPAEAGVEGEGRARGRLRAFEESQGAARSGTGNGKPDDHLAGEREDGRGSPEAAGGNGKAVWRSGKASPVIVERRFRAGRLALPLAASLLLGIAIWVFVWGPLGADSTGERRSIEGKKTVEAESPAVGEAYAPGERETEGVASVEAPTGSEEPAVVEEADADSPSAEGRSRAKEPAETPETVSPSPSPPPLENHAPVAVISGPSTVSQWQTVTYQASGSDPDGDPVSLSWTSRTVQFNTSESVTLTVTVTDSRGASSTASKTVHVI